MSSLAIAYGMNKKKKMEDTPIEADEMKSGYGAEPMESEKKHDFGGDIIDRIMQKMAHGGEVANGGEDELSHMADGMPNNFDDLALDDHLESTNTGASDGDFLGDAQEDSDRSDIISRIMKSRSKKDRNPSPA